MGFKRRTSFLDVFAFFLGGDFLALFLLHSSCGLCCVSLKAFLEGSGTSWSSSHHVCSFHRLQYYCIEPYLDGAPLTVEVGKTLSVIIYSIKKILHISIDQLTDMNNFLMSTQSTNRNPFLNFVMKLTFHNQCFI